MNSQENVHLYENPERARNNKGNAEIPDTMRNNILPLLPHLKDNKSDIHPPPIKPIALPIKGIHVMHEVTTDSGKSSVSVK